MREPIAWNSIGDFVTH